MNAALFGAALFIMSFKPATWIRRRRREQEGWQSSLPRPKLASCKWSRVFQPSGSQRSKGEQPTG